MLENLLKPVLVTVVAFILKFALEAIGVELDEGTFVAIVAAIVAYLLALFGVDQAARSNPSLFRKG